ncbi:MAG TPA: type II toxin-antitoxin system PemK/MazF family toxin [Frankiaceae bacterium]|nr:type II toxin-antitoxin system PemK/MazF family toxin [Frankiaceae bacterium]
MIERGGVFWVDFGPAVGSAPAKRRPAVVVQSDDVNRSAIGSVVVASLTSNTQLGQIPGNVFVPASATGLPKDSVVNVSQLSAVPRDDLDGPVGQVPLALMREVDDGLRRVLAL